MTLAVESPLAAYRAAYDAQDLDALLATMRPDVRLKSPITDRFAFEGRAQLRALMEDVFAVVDDSAHLLDLGDERTRVMKLTGRIKRQHFSETLIFTLDDEGLIASIEIFVRPMPGLTTMAATLGPRVARRRGRLRAVVARMMMAPLAAMTRGGEPLGARLASPRG
jgi:aryl carrier-like protein